MAKPDLQSVCVMFCRGYTQTLLEDLSKVTLGIYSNADKDTEYFPID